MKFENLCHLIRAATSICEQTDFVVIGSQSVLGSWPSAPASLLVSEEIDAWPKCAAGREKDVRFVGEVLRSGKVGLPVLEDRIRTLETSDAVRDLARTIAHRAAQETP